MCLQRCLSTYFPHGGQGPRQARGQEIREVLSPWGGGRPPLPEQSGGLRGRKGGWALAVGPPWGRQGEEWGPMLGLQGHAW